MQTKIPFNYEWLYKPSFADSDAGGTIDKTVFEKIDLPHTNRMLPYNYFDEEEYQFVSCYAKFFTASKDWNEKDIFLDFEGVMIAAQVYVNGNLVCIHEGGYTPFSANITDAVSLGKDNCIIVRVDSTERKDIPPFGNVVDFLTYGGIYREVYLRVADKARLEEVFLTSSGCLSEEAKITAEVCINSEKDRKATLSVLLWNNGTRVSEKTEQVKLPTGNSRHQVTLESLRGITLWDIDNPYLYDVEVKLDCEHGEDIKTESFGFRESEFCTDGYYLNGRKIKLIGLNRHQSYPYVGYAMPKRIQKADASLLKKEAGINVVRCSHYPQSSHFLEECDRLGLLVIEEIPGWQHIGDEAWKGHALKDVEDMIVRDYNHPSVILWGVRINESQDDHDFYTATNTLARKLDPSRQIGGTRYIQRSEFLEDVYTYNDFSLNGGDLVFRPQKESTGLDCEVPTLVTESNGHMYPTKRFDHETRLTEHAIRHLRVINESGGRDDLVGGISWCAFDYNTHGCFGSGDKICYHGVYDMFRNPKYAAFSYSSQKEPEEGIVLEPATIASRGEKDGGGIVPFTILTNCDYVKVFKNEKEVGDFYPDGKNYPYLKHPPVIVSHVLEKDENFGFSAEDMAKFKEFLIDRITSGHLLDMDNADIAYLMELASKYDMKLPKLFEAVIKMAGGWGDCENNIGIVGYVDGKEVLEKEIGEHKSRMAITVKPDDRILLCKDDTFDATRITVSALDSFGNLMPFTQDCIQVELEGPGSILGPKSFALTGGITSFWVRTVGEPGTIKVKVQGMYHSAECEIEVAEAFVAANADRI